MWKILPWAMAVVLSSGVAEAAQPKAPKASTKAAPAAKALAAAPASTLTCVGLYSETDAGYASYRVGTGPWTVIKVGDTIPGDAQIQISVDRDWVELTPTGNPGAVYEIAGSDSGPVTRSVAEILQGTARPVGAPKPSGDKPDPAFKDRLFVAGYLGRQIYTNPAGDEKDVKYGDVLALKGKVTIIAINNTITLMDARGKATTVIGPLKFDVEKVLKNEKLYKFLNVPR